MPRKKSPVALRATRPLVLGDGWEEVELAMLASPADADVLARLEAVLCSEGRFRAPVIVDPIELTVLDGTHRIVAALRTGMAIEVAFDYPPGCPDSEVREVTFVLEIADPPVAEAWAGERGEDDLGDLGQVARSAAINALESVPTDDGWITSLGFAEHADGTCTASWLPEADRSIVDDRCLTELLVERARRAGVALTVLQIVHEPEWLAEP